MTSNISPTQLSTVNIEWGSLREVWFLRGAYASLRRVGKGHGQRQDKWTLTVESECLHKAYAV